jgi:hypothetical protein
MEKDLLGLIRLFQNEARISFGYSIAV